MQMFYAVAVLFMLSFNVFAKEPTDKLVESVSQSVFRVQVGLNNGGFGVGSAVLIAKDKLVTNCHVVRNASSIAVIYNGEGHTAISITPDWKHDVCIIHVPYFEGKIAETNTNSINYTQDVFNVGFPGFLPMAQTTIGKIVGLYSMDNEFIIQTTSSFKLGESGGGLFNDNGQLVGIITLKSPEPNSYYYNMPVKWALDLLNEKEQRIGGESELPFWAKSEFEWPYFMQVVSPFKNEKWDELYNISLKWVHEDPSSDGAWYYLGIAEYYRNHLVEAEFYLKNSNKLNRFNNFSLYYLTKIADDTGKRMESLNYLNKLILIDETEGLKLKKLIHADN